MPLEDLTGSDKFLDALNKDWPLDDDERPEGDNHIRGIKNVLLNTFGPLAAAWDAARAVLWDPPADGQIQRTGSIPMAYGSTAQRPTNPSTLAWRWNSDAQAGGWIIEHWSGSAWTKSVPAMNINNFYGGHSDFYCGDDQESWANVKGVRWFSAENGSQASLMRSKLTAANEAEIQLWCLVGGVLNTVMSLTAAGVDFRNIGAVMLDGQPLMGTQPKYDSGQVAFSAGQEVIFTHGLGYRPGLYRIMLECVETDRGYAVGAEVEFGTVCGTNDTQNNLESAISSAYIDNDTEIKARISSRAIALPDGSGNFGWITMTRWRLRCLAW